MSRNKAKQLTLEVRRIRSSARAGFIDDYATCSPKSLTSFWPFVNAAPDDAEETAGTGKPVITR